MCGAYKGTKDIWDREIASKNISKKKKDINWMPFIFVGIGAGILIVGYLFDYFTHNPNYCGASILIFIIYAIGAAYNRIFMRQLRN